MQSTADSYCAPTYRRWRSVKYWIDILPIVRLMDDSWVEWTIDVILDKSTRFLYHRRCSDGLGNPQRDGAGTKFWSKEKYPEREWNGGGGENAGYWGVYISIDQCPNHAILLTLMMAFEIAALTRPVFSSVNRPRFLNLFFCPSFGRISRWWPLALLVPSQPNIHVSLIFFHSCHRLLWWPYIL